MEYVISEEYILAHSSRLSIEDVVMAFLSDRGIPLNTEYRVIKEFGGNLRVNAKDLGGFEYE